MNTAEKKITIIEVGPRDGLQNEKKPISLADKIKFIELLAAAGFAEIEAGSFVSPKWVPQMADSENLFKHFVEVAPRCHPRPNPIYIALVPNEKGMESALKVGVKKIAVFTAASETFNQKNINCSIAESFERIEPVIKSAKQCGIVVRGYVSTAFVCPYEGVVSANQAGFVISRLIAAGVDEVSIGDTIGQARSDQVKNLLDVTLKENSAAVFAMHFHDTYQHALDNVAVALKFGITRYDSSAAGLGGCPYAPGAKGNLNTATLVEFLSKAGYETGVNLQKLLQASTFIEGLVRAD